jgi:hypothetical protein
MGGRRCAAVALVVLTAGCAASADPGADAPSSAVTATTSLSAGPTVPPVPGIEAEAVRQRTDEAIGNQVQVRITNTGEDPFTVTSVALDSPGFAPVPPRQASTEFTPGRTIDLPVTFGEPRCEVAAEPAAARLTVVRPDGSTEDLRVPLAAEIMTRIHGEECAVLALLEVVDVEVVDLVDDDEALLTDLRLSRRSGDEPVTVARVSRSVILDVTGEELPVELTGDQDELSTPLVFTSATCDPHALAETKKPYVFPLEVTVGDGEPVVMDLPVDDDLRAGLERLVNRVCLQD